MAKDSSDDIRFMSDEDLVAGAKKGQGTAFDEFHNRHAAKMFRVAHRITRNREDAEDAVQECFLNAFIHLKAFDGRSKFSTWLTRIATNAALMKLRKNRGSREVRMEDPVEAPGFHTEDAPADSSLNPEECFAKSEREAILRDAVARLRPSIRKVIEVHQLQECSLSETSEVLGISLAATKGANVSRAGRAAQGKGTAGCDSRDRVLGNPSGKRCFFSGVAMTKRMAFLDWYQILRLHYQSLMFEVIRYALWLTR